MARKANRTCGWCCTPVYSTIKRPAPIFCTAGCRDANAMFELMFSDEEINRRRHYAKITGVPYPQITHSPKEGDAKGGSP